MRSHHAAPEGHARDDPASDAFVGGFGPFEMTLAGELDASAMARAAVGGWIAGRVDDATLAEAQLLVGELVGNSVRHADTPDGATVTVRVEIRGDALHLEVQDAGTSGSILRRPPDLEHGGGFGLNLVEALSRRWGVARDAGTRVWAEVGLAGARGATVVPAPAASPDGAAEQRRAAALSAQARAGSAGRRARAARRAGERAATEYARRSHYRIADVHAAVARHHEDVARRLRLSGPDGGPEAA
jgi:serine/threonine-protein kinase RsbW